jgi:3-oxoacyl-[acyl-carrier-protein] synthase II
MTWSIAGTGAVASVGAGVSEVFEALCAGRTGLAKLRAFDRSRLRVGHAYEIDDRTGPGRDEPGRATRWLCAAIEEALLDAGMPTELGDVPVLVGTGLRELRSAELWWREGTPLREADLHLGTALREHFGATRTYTVVNACAASLYACGLATDLLAAGEADTVVVAGVDAVTESMFGLLDRVHPQPPDVLRPFDRARRGVLMGEAAAVVVLRRGGPARAVLRGVGLTCDAYHVTAPDPEGIASAITDAYDRSGIRPEEVDLVYAHGTGTLLNDEAEATALAKVLAETGATPLITAIKSMTGHTSGASGLLGLVAAVESLRSGRVPPTLGLVDPVPEASGLRLVRGQEVAAPVWTAQIDAFGFGGVNAVAIVTAA